MTHIAFFALILLDPLETSRKYGHTVLYAFDFHKSTIRGVLPGPESLLFCFIGPSSVHNGVLKAAVLPEHPVLHLCTLP